MIDRGRPDVEAILRPTVFAGYLARADYSKIKGDRPRGRCVGLLRVFRGSGVDPGQYRSAAEALLRRLTKQGELRRSGRWWISRTW